MPSCPTRTARRCAALVLAAATLLAAAGCGSNKPAGPDSTETASGLGAVSVSGDVGSAPDISWKGQMSVDGTDQKTLVEGPGAKIGTGDQVLAQIVIGNGFTKSTAFSSYQDDQPQLITLDEAQIAPIFLDAIKGATVGSRVVVAASASDAFGPEGNPNLGIANQDSVLLVIDLLSEPLTEPSGTRSPAPSWMPGIEFTKGQPSGFNFSRGDKPVGQFRKAVLLKGDGPQVKQGQTIVADYLGEVYDGKAPFDESYTKQPISQPLTGFIKGWQSGLVGVPVGSRVVLQIPPAFGYGKDGNKQAGIKGTDTLFFVVDILAAA